MYTALHIYEGEVQEDTMLLLPPRLTGIQSEESEYGTLYSTGREGARG